MKTEIFDFEKSFNELAIFIVEANTDLAIAQGIEDYEQCALIQTAIDLRLHNDAVMLSEYNQKPLPEVFKMLKQESNFIYQMMIED